LRRDEVDVLVSQVVTHVKFSKRVLLGQLLLNPWIGSIVAVIILYSFLYQFLGVFVAGTVVDFLENGILNTYYSPWVEALVSRVFPVIHDNIENIIISEPLTAIGTFLAGDYGVLTLTITYLYGLLLPLVLGFYFGLAILEDSGYLPRLAVLVDGILSRLGMNGRAIIPLILGGGCVTMATVTTRLLTNPKEKLITMAVLGLTIPCSAQLGVIQGLLSNVGGVMPWLIWSGTLFIVFVLTGMILNQLIPGPCGNFISDIPPMRLPRFSNIMKKTFLRSKVFLDEATPAFFLAAALVAFMQITGMLGSIIKAAEPMIQGVLLLPKEVAISFILGMVRRDFGAFGLMSIPMSASQLITSCTVLTLFVPCIATVAIMIKEGSFKTAMGIWISSWVLALGIGAILARLLPTFM
jgi:ferrous iron transport protein B